MQEVASQDEQALQAQLQDQLSQAREQLYALVQKLHGIDRELEDLSTERHQYRLLQKVCGELEELSAQGAADLFWGQGAAAKGEGHLRLVWGRVDAFEKRLSEIEERRQAVVEEIERAQENTEFLEDDIFEAQRLAEQRKLEWIIEREIDSFPVAPSVMPWARGGEDDKLFRKALATALLLSLLLGLVFPAIDLPLPEPWEAIDVPERFTRLIREEIPPPPPPPHKARPEEVEPKLAKESSGSEPTATPTKKQANKRSPSSKGILAFREKFSGLAENKPSARLGSQARIRNMGAAASGRPQRSLVSIQGSGASGGIDVGSLSRDVGGGGGGHGMGGVEISRATSSIGAITGPDRPLSDGPGLSRTDEEIQIVFDRNKAALYRLYNRELRRDPTLKGQMVLRITIQPDGSVSLCELQSTDMKAEQLSAQVLARVRNFDFGAKDGIPAITILYPIDFLPAA